MPLTRLRLAQSVVRLRSARGEQLANAGDGAGSSDGRGQIDLFQDVDAVRKSLKLNRERGGKGTDVFPQQLSGVSRHARAEGAGPQGAGFFLGRKTPVGLLCRRLRVDIFYELPGNLR
jgi:hypothetical protein